MKWFSAEEMRNMLSDGDLMGKEPIDFAEATGKG